MGMGFALMPVRNANNFITLYHGSISLFDKPDADKGKPYKDFGKGFYVSQEKQNAINIALRNKLIEESRNKRFGKTECVSAFLYTFEFNPAYLKNYSIKEFSGADKEWLRFVIANRSSSDKSHTYDAVIGPTANDDTRASLRAYNAGAYGEQDNDEAMDMLINRLKVDKLPEQIYFSNNDILSHLTLKGDVIKL